MAPTRARIGATALPEGDTLNHVTPACATGNHTHCTGFINPRKTRPITCWCQCHPDK